ncbi:MAG: potassium channel protein [Candidatus Schekmanbacteria bacterium]|nr:potassium channel protein [Candidatus Schekmanbacteria bacterium]
MLNPSTAPGHGHGSRALVRSACAVLLIFAAGTIGYYGLGGPTTTWLDAMYMTTITLTTVGYTAVVDLSGTAVRAFTVLLLLVGVGTFVYFFSAVTAFAVEGTLDRIMWRRRMTRQIGKMSNHVIVCGGGNTGEYVVRELDQTGRPFVLVELDPGRAQALYDMLGREFAVVIGDATSDDVLHRAGVERAAGLVACISGDKDNLVVTFTARQLNPSMRIVTRCVNDAEQHKLVKAGANAVVSPNRIGGLRLVSELVRPAVVTFLDQMLRDRERRLRVEEVTIGAGSDLDGATVAALHGQAITGLLLMAVRRPDGSWVYSPPETLELEAGMGLIFIAAPGTRRVVEEAAGAPTAVVELAEDTHAETARMA